MNTDKLYIVKHECEDDPYCAHWDETDIMTHNYNNACDCILNLINKKPGDELSYIFYDKNIRDNFCGFIDVYVYDKLKNEYTIEYREYLSKYQVNIYDNIDFSSFDSEFIEFMKLSELDYYEHTFTFPLKFRTIGGFTYECSFSMYMKKIRVGDNDLGHYVIFTEGSDETKMTNNYRYYGMSSGVYDLSIWKPNTTQDIVNFGHNILNWCGNVFGQRFSETIDKIEYKD